MNPGNSPNHHRLPLTERVGYFVQPPPKKPASGVIEGESLKVLSKTAGDPQEQDMTAFGDRWSNDGHLWWINAKPGDALTLALPVEKAGKYQLRAQLTKAMDYGIVQLALDGKKLSGPIDLYNNGVVPTGELDLSQHELTAGEHQLSVTITGANEKAVKSYMFGLDYVKLVEVK